MAKDNTHRKSAEAQEHEVKTRPQDPDDGSTSSCEVSPPVPPDGGYGWVIMFASFICNVIVDGVCFSFGIFFLEFLKYFGESKSKTAWVGSVLNGMYLSMGPIVSALANKFGCRAVTIAGSIVACIAYVLATFSPNIDILILTYGALGGAGFGLMYLPAIVMVGYYFEKKRAFATGVAVCGSGIGAFVFAPLTEKLLSMYSWKGATLIVGGITLHGVVMGALFRPLEANCRRKTVKTVEAGDGDLTKPSLNGDISKPEVYVENADSKINGHVVEGQGGVGARPKMTLDVGKLEPKDLLRTKMAANMGQAVPDAAQTKTDKSFIHSMHNLSPTHFSSSPAITRQLSKSVDDILLKNKKDQEVHQKARDIRRPLYRKDIFYSGSVMHLPEYKSNQNVSFAQSMTSIPRTPSVAHGEEKNGGCSQMCKSLTDTLGQMMDFSLMKNPVFAIYGISCFLCMTGFFVPFMYLPDDAILKGVPRGNAAFLLSIIGIANTIARVLCGWVSDRPWADCLLINNLALIIGGVATILSPFCGNYGLLATYAAVFGSAIAVFVSLRSILMVELIGLDKLTNAFGLVTMCQGMSSFIGAPIAGALYDATGDYAISFYFAGTALLLAGLICLPLRRVARWQTAREERQKLQRLVSPTEESVCMIQQA